MELSWPPGCALSWAGVRSGRPFAASMGREAKSTKMSVAFIFPLYTGRCVAADQWRVGSVRAACGGVGAWRRQSSSAVENRRRRSSAIDDLNPHAHVLMRAPSFLEFLAINHEAEALVPIDEVGLGVDLDQRALVGVDPRGPLSTHLEGLLHQLCRDPVPARILSHTNAADVLPLVGLPENSGRPDEVHATLGLVRQEVLSPGVDVGVVDLAVGAFLLVDKNIDAEFVQLMDLGDGHVHEALTGEIDAH